MSLFRESSLTESSRHGLRLKLRTIHFTKPNAEFCAEVK